MVIYVDMDNTLCDTYKAIESYANEYYDLGITIYRERLFRNRTIPILVNCGTSEKLANEIRNSIGNDLDYWAERIQIAEGARDIMRFLCKNHQVHIATSTFLIEGFACMNGKVLWLKKNLPFYNIKNTIYTNFKYNLIGDMLIDDVSVQVEGFRGRKIIRDFPYNRGYTGCDVRFNEWTDENFVEFITSLQKN